ncbi:MAG: purine-nucleoside phosphorylase [Gemmatimonadota bacterium]
MSDPPAPHAEQAAEALRARLNGLSPRVAVTMGSGLGGLAGRFENPVEIPYGELPGWPEPGIAGHAGRVIAGSLGGVAALGLAGRVHLYEGHAPARVLFYVRVLGRLGIPVLFLSNAAGTLNRNHPPGDLMLLRDHMDLAFQAPLRGPVEPGELRFPDMSEPYDRGLRGEVREAAREQGVRLHEGVYAALVGPSYETPAEIRMLERLGADAVGMSTVPEVIGARALGIRCVAVSCLTNWAAGITPEPLRHEEVLETTERAAGTFENLVVRSVERFASAGRL